MASPKSFPQLTKRKEVTALQKCKAYMMQALSDEMGTLPYLYGDRIARQCTTEELWKDIKFQDMTDNKILTYDKFVDKISNSECSTIFVCVGNYGAGGTSFLRKLGYDVSIDKIKYDLAFAFDCNHFPTDPQTKVKFSTFVSDYVPLQMYVTVTESETMEHLFFDNKEQVAKMFDQLFEQELKNSEVKSPPRMLVLLDNFAPNDEFNTLGFIAQRPFFHNALKHVVLVTHPFDNLKETISNKWKTFSKEHTESFELYKISGLQDPANLISFLGFQDDVEIQSNDCEKYSKQATKQMDAFTAACCSTSKESSEFSILSKIRETVWFYIIGFLLQKIPKLNMNEMKIYDIVDANILVLWKEAMEDAAYINADLKGDKQSKSFETVLQAVYNEEPRADPLQDLMRTTLNMFKAQQCGKRLSISNWISFEHLPLKYRYLFRVSGILGRDYVDTMFMTRGLHLEKEVLQFPNKLIQLYFVAHAKNAQNPGKEFHSYLAEQLECMKQLTESVSTRHSTRHAVNKPEIANRTSFSTTRLHVLRERNSYALHAQNNAFCAHVCSSVESPFRNFRNV